MPKQKFRSARMPPVNCPSCGKGCDTASILNEDPHPRPGDLLLCAYCGALLMSMDGAQVRILAESEESNLPDEARKQIQTGRRAIAGAQLEVARGVFRKN